MLKWTKKSFNKVAKQQIFIKKIQNPAPEIVYGQRVDCFGITAGSCRSPLLHSEWKENLRTER